MSTAAPRRSDHKVRAAHPTVAYRAGSTEQTHEFNPLSAVGCAMRTAAPRRSNHKVRAAHPTVAYRVGSTEQTHEFIPLSAVGCAMRTAAPRRSNHKVRAAHPTVAYQVGSTEQTHEFIPAIGRRVRHAHRSAASFQPCGARGAPYGGVPGRFDRTDPRIHPAIGRRVRHAHRSAVSLRPGGARGAPYGGGIPGELPAPNAPAMPRATVPRQSHPRRPGESVQWPPDFRARLSDP